MRGVQRWLAIATPLIVGGLAFGSWTAAGVAATPRAPLAQAGAAAGVPAAGGSILILNAPRAEGNDARGLRLALVGTLALALACSVAAQYHQFGGRRTTPHNHLAAGGGRQRGADNGDRHGARPEGESIPIGAAPLPSAPRVPEEERWREEGTGAATDGATPAASRARAQCARAIAAAFSYDRAGTVAAFTTALTSDPGVKPTTTPGFWDLPSTGHADLARAYLRCGRPLDARSVLTVALLSFRHNRELETLLRETVPRWDAGRPTE